MPPIPFADNFLAGSLITLLIPCGLLIAIAIWYGLTIKRVPQDTPASSTALRSPEVLAGAPPPAPGQTPPEPPAGQS